MADLVKDFQTELVEVGAEINYKSVSTSLT